MASSPPRRRSRFFGRISLLPILLGVFLSLPGLLLPGANESAFPPGSTLILSAHPDDEAMFFAPAIQSLGKDRDVWAVCMSTGNAEKLGSVRREELTKSYGVLGIKENKIKLFDHPELQDGMRTVWDPALIASLVQPIIDKNNISVILTFDSHGITHHPNHISLSLSAPLLTLPPSLPPSARLKTYYLRTHPPPLKFLSFTPSLYAHLSHLYSGPAAPGLARTDEVLKGEEGDEVRVVRASVGWKGWERGVRAMLEHGSQMRWFRWLYVGTSRYMWEGRWVLVEG